MARTRNKLIPTLGGLAIAMLAYVGYKAATGSDRPVKAGPEMVSVPSSAASAPAHSGIFQKGQPAADADKPEETLSTLVARLAANDATVQKVLQSQKAIDDRLQRMETSSQAAAQPRPTESQPIPKRESDKVDEVRSTLEASEAKRLGIANGLGFDGVLDGGKAFRPPSAGSTKAPAGQVGGVVQYEVIQPLGVDRTGGPPPGERQANTVADAAPAQPKQAEPYFTIPENATLTKVTTMTSLIGRIPVDGKVQDPMQFKAIVGRENLAANGLDVPDEISGIIVSGVAVGDMGMSCSEGHIYSLTYVFEDGSIRTVSNRKGSTGGSRDKALGYLSDEYGNPCIAGKFVTNAPAYLTDITGLRFAGIAARAYGAAQTSTTERQDFGTSTTSVTGSRGAYVLGQAAGGAVDEVSNWVTSRLKNSFDAVVTPAGKHMVLHIDQEIALDKAPNARRLDHRLSRAQSTGEQHGLE